ncbi:haloacid dehalogenase type II [Desertibaculum subflavum]|uniref:haloacid dehalogenase type II n=1 Tax=Desertibaculum subflavum TaxID=2268458 RepID=UPI000E66AA95
MAEAVAGVRACVFDAYGTLFDVNSAAARLAGEIGESWLKLAETWRAKQLQYTWLRSLMGAHADFEQVTGEALDFALAQSGIADADLRRRLMALYFTLDAYPEVPDMLRRLKAKGLKTAILSNGSPAMLDAAVKSAGIASSLDAVLSVEDAGIYKPHGSVYRLATAHFGVDPAAILFLSSNGWDAHGAAHFGFRVFWVNRFGQPPERLPGAPERVLSDLRTLPELVAG